MSDTHTHARNIVYPSAMSVSIWSTCLILLLSFSLQWPVSSLPHRSTSMGPRIGNRSARHRFGDNIMMVTMYACVDYWWSTRSSHSCFCTSPLLLACFDPHQHRTISISSVSSPPSWLVHHWLSCHSVYWFMRSHVRVRYWSKWNVLNWQRIVRPHRRIRRKVQQQARQIRMKRRTTQRQQPPPHESRRRRIKEARRQRRKAIQRGKGNKPPCHRAISPIVLHHMQAAAVQSVRTVKIIIFRYIVCIQNDFSARNKKAQRHASSNSWLRFASRWLRLCVLRKAVRDWWMCVCVH